MRRVIAAWLLVGVLALASCAPETPTDSAGTGTIAAASCTPADLATLKPDTMTIGTGNPAYPPWFEGGEGAGEWKINDPSNGEGFEGAVAYAVADKLGYTPDQVAWVDVPFNKSYAPGPKDFDLVLQQISYSPKRAQAVDFSDSYYDVNQAVVTTKGSAIDEATTIAELQGAKLGAPIGTTSYDTIEQVVQPTQEPSAYDDLNGAVQDLKNGQLDGVVVDLPTAFYITAVQIPKGTIVGQFPVQEQQEYFAMAFEKGSPLVDCINQAIGELRGSGELDALQQQWLAEKTSAPVLSP